MEQKWFIVPIIVLLASCINHKDADEQEITFWGQPKVHLKIEYAKGFQIQYQKEFTTIITKSIEGNTWFRDSVYLLHQETKLISDKAKLIKPKDFTVACQSSTHLSYINYLNNIENVIGVCGLNYIQNESLIQKLEQNQTKEICLGEALQMEALLSLHPDLYMIYPFSAEERENIENNRVNTLMIAEYLETDPLARLEWIKLFGLLFDKAEEANEYFEKVEKEYIRKKNLIKTESGTFFMNLPFGESWHAPSKSSLIVNLCRDAGLEYYFQNETGTENVTHTQEEMWEVGTAVPYWIIIANRPEGFSIQDLVEEEEVYSTFKSVKENKVIFCNTATSDYFTQGVIEPHIMLNEINSALNGNLLENAKYFKILK